MVLALHHFFGEDAQSNSDGLGQEYTKLDQDKYAPSLLGRWQQCGRDEVLSRRVLGCQDPSFLPACIQHVGHEGDWAGTARCVHYINDN